MSLSEFANITVKSQVLHSNCYNTYINSMLLARHSSMVTLTACSTSQEQRHPFLQ